METPSTNALHETRRSVWAHNLSAADVREAMQKAREKPASRTIIIEAAGTREIWR